VRKLVVTLGVAGGRRPVDVAEGLDGAFYVSDDYAGAVYRVAWDG
jgi:glucose/arabinose dehydrogenase